MRPQIDRSSVPPSCLRETQTVRGPATPFTAVAAGVFATPRQRISLCLVAKNEEKTLPTCLGSIADLVDDIILVDTGSTDHTKEVATSFGARVFDFAWADDFSAARNECLRHAGGDWIFWLDGDEWLDEENRRKLRNLLGGLGTENRAYVMKNRSEQGSGGDSIIVVDQVRLFRNHPELRWHYRVHEQILPAVYRLGATLQWTGVVIHHSGYRDPALRQQKLQRNLRLLQIEDGERPNDPWTLFNLGVIYLEMGKTRDALGLLLRSLERSQPGAPFLRKLYVLLGQGYLQSGQRDLALAAYQAGRTRFPEDSDLLFHEAILLRELGDLAGAEKNLVHFLSREEEGHFAMVDAGLRGFKARHNLAMLYHEQGRSDAAEAQ